MFGLRVEEPVEVKQVRGGDGRSVIPEEISMCKGL